MIHNDPQYHADIKALESYVLEELNLREIEVTAEETKFGVKYRAEADLKVLGQKLKKDAMKVKKALPDLTDAQVKAFVDAKTMEVAGLTVTDEDINVVRYFDANAEHQYETNTDRDVLVLLDVKSYPELEQEGLAREVINRVQRLRKKAGLLPTDDIHMHYRIKADVANIEDVIKSHPAIAKALKKPILGADALDLNTVVLITEETQDVNGTTFDLIFSK